LSDILLLQDPSQSPETRALIFVNPDKGVSDIEEALQGAEDIIAELISDNAEYRKFIRISRNRRIYYHGCQEAGGFAIQHVLQLP